MNCNALNYESHRKPRRKRHRNKSRNSNLRKKRLKKFHYKIKSETVKTNISKLESVNVRSKIMSNWYWSNYRKALEWQERHKTAHWKACTLALLEENRHLLQIINRLNPGMHPAVSLTENYINKGNFSAQNPVNLNNSNSNMYSSVNDTYDIERKDYEDQDHDDDGDENNETDDVEFEMSEEMLKFFEQSYKHKMEMQELKEKESLHNAENKIKQLQTNKMKRSTEMNLLYGDGASMIIGMETAVQLSFEKYCDTKSPKYWPNIPFRL